MLCVHFYVLQGNCCSFTACQSGLLMCGLHFRYPDVVQSRTECSKPISTAPLEEGGPAQHFALQVGCVLSQPIACEIWQLGLGFGGQPNKIVGWLD